MEIGICSFSFHRLLAAGKQDIFQYILDCKALGCTQLDPWNAHLSQLKSGDEVLHAGHNPGESQHLSAVDETYVDRVKAAADQAQMPFGCLAIDGTHIYEEYPAARELNRQRAYRWLDIGHKLGAKQARIDAGGPEEMPDDIFKIIVEGYKDVIAYGQARGIEILVENHWGPTVLPDNVIRLLEAVPGLGLLLDSHNWREDKREEAWERCAPYAKATHFKTFQFDEDGNDPTENVARAIQVIRDSGYRGSWGVESVPEDGDEIVAARKTIELIRRLAA